MSESSRTSAGHVITAILPADDDLEALIREAFHSCGITSYVTHRTRGALPGCPVDSRSVPIWQEMIILEGFVPEDHAETVFRRAYEAGIDGRTNGGMLLMGRVSRTSALPAEPPSLPATA